MKANTKYPSEIDLRNIKRGLRNLVKKLDLARVDAYIKTETSKESAKEVATAG